MRFVACLLLSTAAITLPLRASAEPEPEQEPAMIVVKGQTVRGEDGAWSTTTLKTSDIRKEGFSDVDKLLRLVPGVSVRDLGLAGVANNIVIRGFGNGGHGGDLGAVIDGIPLNEAMSHADGYVDLNVVVPLEIGALTVYRGPVSALYGNYNRGGLLRIDTRKDGDYAHVDASLGAFRTADMQLAAGQGWDGGQVNIAGQFYVTDGFRPRSDQERQTAAVRARFDLAPSIRMVLSGRYHHADANSASYLTIAQFERDRDGVDARAGRDGAAKHFATARADLSFALSPSASLVTFAYATRQDFTRWFSRPVAAETWRQREESYDRDVSGLGASLNGTITTGFAAAPITYAVGVEGFAERTDFLFFDALVDRRRTGAALNDRRTKLNSLSGFAEVVAPLHRLFDLSLGLRGDRFTGGCERLGLETGSDPCGTLRRTGTVSPKIGGRSQVTDWLQLRGSWARGFALANNFVKYAVGGQALEPNVFRQVEVGTKLTPSGKLTIDVAAFRLTSTQEVRTVSPGIFENYGATRRQGIEASARWNVTPRVEVGGVYGHVETRVLDNGDAALIGKAVAGVPTHSANIDATWSPIDGWSLSGMWRHVGKYQLNATNTSQAPAYDTFDLSIAHTATAPFPYRAYLRVDNVADATYATSMVIIAGQTLVAPGPGRAVRAGIQLSL